MVNLTSDYDRFGAGFLSDHSTLLLILSNLIMIFFAIFENWNLLTIMFIYWCQSVIIGVFTFFKILSLKNFSTDEINSSLNITMSTTRSKVVSAFFFLFHYSGFHFGYFFFLIANPFYNSSSQASFTGITVLIVVVIFFINHLFSFLYNRKKDAKKKRNIRKIMMFPYIRIIPMHLTIIFGSYFIMTGAPQISLIFFLILKIIADVAMHVIEHKEASAEKIQLLINKAVFSPGEKITGSIKLEMNRPLKAKSLKASFIVEKIVIGMSSEGRSKRRFKIYQDEKILDANKMYHNETYNFVFNIPSDIFNRIEDFSQQGYTARARRISEKYENFLGITPFVEQDKFYIKAELDVPYGLNITNEQEISISEK